MSVSTSNSRDQAANCKLEDPIQRRGARDRENKSKSLALNNIIKSSYDTFEGSFSLRLSVSALI